MAERISSLSCLSIPPPVSASSIMVISSSSVMLLSPEDLNIFDSSALSPIKAKLNGARITVKNLSIGAENIAKLSAFSFAMLLGDISPNIRTATVMTTVEIVTPFTGKYFVNTIVAIEAEAMFTILFPIRIVDSILS